MSPRATALARLEVFRGAVEAERKRMAEVQHQERLASMEVSQQREALTTAIAEGKSERAPRAALDKAEAAATEPWTERRAAAERRVRQAEGAVAAFIEQNLVTIKSEMEPRAERARDEIEQSLQGVLDAITAWQAVDGQWTELLRPIGALTDRPMPMLGLDGIRRDVRDALEQGIPEPMPRTGVAA